MLDAANKLNDALRGRVAFERFLADLSAEFINVASDRVERKIEEGLRRLAEYLEIDRTNLARLTPEGDFQTLVVYSVPGAVPSIPDYDRGVPWYAGEMRAGRIVQLPRLADLPPEASAERTLCESVGVRSHFGIPINVGGMPLCVLGLTMFQREIDFADEMISRLRLIGEVFANALARRDADDALRRMHNDLAHVTRVSTVGQLAASIAHEVNQPLCAIIANAEAALNFVNAPQTNLTEVREALADIIASGKLAGDVIARSHRLLKRRETQIERLSVNQLVRDVCAVVRGEALMRKIKLTWELSDSAPEILGDRVQLQQVMLNLLVNAMDAVANAPTGERHVMARTQKSPSNDGGSRVTVRDNGIGLTAEVAAKMFDPFFTTKLHGLGMGLAINRTIVNAHGGQLGAAANSPGDGGGTSVWFDLPGGKDRTIGS